MDTRLALMEHDLAMDCNRSCMIVCGSRRSRWMFEQFFRDWMLNYLVDFFIFFLALSLCQFVTKRGSSFGVGHGYLYFVVVV